MIRNVACLQSIGMQAGYVSYILASLMMRVRFLEVA